MTSLLQAVLPAVVGAIVGTLTVWLGLRQMRETARLATEQLAHSAKTANEQIAAHLSAAHLSYRAQVLLKDLEVLMQPPDVARQH